MNPKTCHARRVCCGTWIFIMGSESGDAGGEPLLPRPQGGHDAVPQPTTRILPRSRSARQDPLAYRRRMRSAEGKGAKGVGPRGNAGFSQDNGENRPGWRYLRDSAVFFAQVALQWETTCVDA